MYASSIRDQDGAVLGSFGVDPVEGHLQPFGVFVDGSLNFLAKVTVDIVPGFRLLGQLVLFPTRNISLDKLHPEFDILIHDMGRRDFQGSLVTVSAFVP